MPIGDDGDDMVMAVRGLMFRFEPSGQEEMKPAARVKTFWTPRGVSKGDGTATALEAVRMKVWWRASTVTISAAIVRILGSDTSGAAPRYLRWIRINSHKAIDKELTLRHRRSRGHQLWLPFPLRS
jgi:hypothetical protein